MSELKNNLSFNIFSLIQKFMKQAGDTPSAKEPQNEIQSNLQKTNINTTTNQTKTTNIPLNQTALDLSSPTKTSTNLQHDLKTNVQATPTQTEFQGPRDLPAYAGIANMSLKSWVANQNNQSFSKLETVKKELTSTDYGIKGFQRKNHEGFDADDGEFNQQNKPRFKNLLLLSHIFSAIEQSGSSNTELLVNINTFKKLGASNAESNIEEEISLNEFKITPPLPNEAQGLDRIDFSQLKYLHQLLALPNQFPECLRLFTRDGLELNPIELHTFLNQRIKLVKEQLFGEDSSLGKEIARFLPLLNQNDFPVMLPLLLLYYPLPLPLVTMQPNLFEEWEKGKKERKTESAQIIASCEIYYLSKTRGRFLLKFELNEKDELAFDVQTARTNNGIVKDLEEAVAESMYLLECSPTLADLNIMLTKEIYNATDINEELFIVSAGPLRLEIVLAVYACLIVLNKLNEDLDPAGLIDIFED